MSTAWVSKWSKEGYQEVALGIRSNASWVQLPFHANASSFVLTSNFFCRRKRQDGGAGVVVNSSLKKITSALLAQLVERATVNREVVGSSPARSGRDSTPSIKKIFYFILFQL